MELSVSIVIIIVSKFDMDDIYAIEYFDLFHTYTVLYIMQMYNSE